MKKWGVNNRLTQEYQQKIKPLLQDYLDGKIKWEEYLVRLKEITDKYTKSQEKKGLPKK